MMPSERGTPLETVHSTPVPTQVIHSSTLRRLTSSRSNLLIAYLLGRPITTKLRGRGAPHEERVGTGRLYSGMRTSPGATVRHTAAKPPSPNLSNAFAILFLNFIVGHRSLTSLTPSSGVSTRTLSYGAQALVKGLGSH